jgi:hypothetical protein
MKLLQFVAILLTALALIPAGAHFFELPNKMHLSRDQYLAVQQIYRGWSYFGVVDLAAIATNLALTVVLWKRRVAFWCALTGVALLTSALAVFFFWTYAAN